MGKFNLNQLLSNASLNDNMAQAGQTGREPKKANKSKQPGSGIIPISVYDLIPSEDNFYSMRQIDELKTAIELAGGVKQNLNVTPLPNGKYKVLAGHRRRLASLALVEEGKREYEFIPCSIESSEEDAALQKIREELLIILTNSQREKTDWDKVEEVRRLRSVLERYKEKAKLPGRVREIIADTLNTSSTQVGRMDAISSNLSPEFKEELKQSNVNISTAYELSGLPEEKQQQAYQEYKDKGSLSIQAVKDIKAQKEGKEKQPRQQPQAQDQPQPQQPTPKEQAPKREEQHPEAVPIPQNPKPLKIYVCSPYGGKEENYLKAVEYCKHVAAQGHIPFASHVMLHGILNDNGERDKGITAGFEMVKLSDEIWTFGETITPGMAAEIDLAQRLGKLVYKKFIEED
ncbi:ParB-like chromosome segregation protein Spo0J [Anaerobacterium chartisolvens]|uniref:ParB-like chromosome segregation protein Spo0J n=1 Tax=Anaerobacterium chartisolvens TaxID=1297424 RepID=A0A369BHM8_9FIRM|nr:ParB/RepB/Spo0J family partition protein [Anaerobacterium chartisolvens]RCX20911.1 ParB-like chromosome segregation protein Spo0J [Anaerobacterium chartisolvens]